MKPDAPTGIRCASTPLEKEIARGLPAPSQDAVRFMLSVEISTICSSENRDRFIVRLLIDGL